MTDNSNAREQIAEAIWEEVDEGTFEYSVNSDKVVDAMADKVLATLPSILEGMIPDLVWGVDEGVHFASSPLGFGQYNFTSENSRIDDGFSLYLDEHEVDVGNFWTHDEAITAANAHHRAEALRPFILSAIGVET